MIHSPHLESTYEGYISYNHGRRRTNPTYPDCNLLLMWLSHPSLRQCPSNQTYKIICQREPRSNARSFFHHSLPECGQKQLPNLSFTKIAQTQKSAKSPKRTKPPIRPHAPMRSPASGGGTPGAKGRVGPGGRSVKLGHAAAARPRRLPLE